MHKHQTIKNSNSWVLDSPSIWGGKTLSSPTCTQQWNINERASSTNKITGASSSIIPAVSGSVTCSWTASGTSDYWDDAAVEVSAQSPSSWHSSTGILIPLYSYPYTNSSCHHASCFNWNLVNQTKNNYTHVPIFVIINPNSGSCGAPCPDPNYQRAIANLTKTGVVVLGYTYTSYGHRTSGPASIATSVENDTSNYTKWYQPYGLKGIMSDEFNGTTGNENYYSTLTNYVHNTNSLTYSFGNPGTDTNSNYISQGTIDELNIYEGANETGNKLTNSTLQGNTQNGGPWHTQYDKSKFSFELFNATSLPSQHWVQGKSIYVGFMYLTDNTGCGTSPSHPANYCHPFNGTNGNPCPPWCQNPWNTTSTYLGTLTSYINKSSLLSTIQAQNTSGNLVSIPIQIYQSNNLVSNQTTPFTYNSTSGFQFNFTSPALCKWTGSASSSTHSLVVAPTSSGVYTATKGTAPC
ncbi:MAG: spherulation-specific family 4 protein [Nitrosotalea sp.]